jgi:hypothetical protein
MAKQNTAAKAAPVTPVATKEIAVEQTITTSKPSWPIKDRSYYLSGGSEPLSFRLNSRHSALKPLLYFDEENGVKK